jgi:endonuclease/exonuclease/phosphatase family metal-dependent hydrolase
VEITVGTFNLNNLFTRFNFEAELDELETADIEVTTKYTFSDPGKYRVRVDAFGSLVHAKPVEEQKVIAERINRMDLDVLAVQEVENIEALKTFSSTFLEGAHHVTLVEGNDPRLIDVGIISKLPLGAVTSWQHAVHPAEQGRRIFSRDLLEVEILNATRTRRLLTLFVNHLKSQFVHPKVSDAESARRAAALLRRRQVETIARIVAARTRPDGAWAVCGDMNDPPGAESLEPLVAAGSVDALTAPRETRPPKPDTPAAPATGSWTHRFKQSGRPASYELFDQIWLSPSLAARQTGAWIDRRRNHGGDGSDHDPAWVVLDL